MKPRKCPLFCRETGGGQGGVSGRKHTPVQGIRKAQGVLEVSMLILLLRGPGFETGQDKWDRETEAGS